MQSNDDTIADPFEDLNDTQLLDMVLERGWRARRQRGYPDNHPSPDSASSRAVEAESNEEATDQQERQELHNEVELNGLRDDESSAQDVAEQAVEEQNLEFLPPRAYERPSQQSTHHRTSSQEPPHDRAHAEPSQDPPSHQAYVESANQSPTSDHDPSSPRRSWLVPLFFDHTYPRARTTRLFTVYAPEAGDLSAPLPVFYRTWDGRRFTHPGPHRHFGRFSHYREPMGSVSEGGSSPDSPRESSGDATEPQENGIETQQEEQGGQAGSSTAGAQNGYSPHTEQDGTSSLNTTWGSSRLTVDDVSEEEVAELIGWWRWRRQHALCAQCSCPSDVDVDVENHRQCECLVAGDSACRLSMEREVDGMFSRLVVRLEDFSALTCDFEARLRGVETSIGSFERVES